ncbi:YCF48-related protein [Streptomyces sp. NPDC001617]
MRANWQAGATRSGMSLWAVHVASDRHWWIVGDEGTVLSTQDGGATWEQHFYSPEKDASARPQPQRQ